MSLVNLDWKSSDIVLISATMQYSIKATKKVVSYLKYIDHVLYVLDVFY